MTPMKKELARLGALVSQLIMRLQAEKTENIRLRHQLMAKESELDILRRRLTQSASQTNRHR